MNKTTTFLSLAAVAVLAGAVLTTTLTNASETESVASATQSQPGMQRGFGRNGGGMKGGFEQVRTAVEANDFTAFQTAVVDTPLATQITTQEQFDKLVQMHTLMQEGKTEEAKVIATELGLPEMEGRGGMRGDPAVREAVKTAVDANDYTAFQTAIATDANGPLAGIDTAEKFAKLVKMNGLLEEAKAIGEELGLPGPHGGEEGEGKGRKGGKGFGGMGMMAK